MLSNVPEARCFASDEAVPSLTVLRSETRRTLRLHAESADEASKYLAATALCDLYVILRQDQRYSESEMLRADAAKIRRRLLSIKRSTESQLRRDGVERPSGLSSGVDSILNAASTAIPDPSATDLVATGYGSRIANEGGNGGGILGADEGWRLVELIQRIIAPDFWDVGGGPGTVKYFAMYRVLVVRATSDVHEQIRELLTALR